MRFDPPMKPPLLSSLTICLILGLLHSTTSHSAAAGKVTPRPIPLWPQLAPGDAAPTEVEKDLSAPTDGLVAGKRLIRLGNVSQPTVTFYPAPRRKSNGAAVLVCPGGGYHILAMDLEGTEVCEWLNSIGVSAALLKYRVPVRKDRERYAAPLQDAQRAMSLVRQHATEWNIDSKRIGILGFSAGGHLAALTSNHFEQRTYLPIDAADQLSCRPDFSVLVYPAYLTVEKEGDRIAPEITLSANTPPTFLVQTEDDSVRVESGLFYYQALKKWKVPAEMHLYASGGHGYGLRPTSEAVTRWPELAGDWMRRLGVLGKAR